MSLPALVGQTESGSPSILKVNISPIFASHLVFVPRASENHPQYLDSVKLLEDGLSLFPLFTDPEHALVGFNSIGGFSTINHLHY
jgi:GDP-L-galactose phosphorylase